jgi:hypothetical protein
VTAQHTSSSAMTDGGARGTKSAQVVLNPKATSQEHQNAVVYLSVAECTQRDEIQLGIVTRVAAEFFMLNFQIRHRTAGLAAPAIAA